MTKPSSEGLACTHLLRQGFLTYYPRLQLKGLYRGRWIERIGSLFPRYLFVRLDLRRQTLGPIRSTRGVTGLVRFGEQATMVPDAVVDSLMSRADPDSGLHRLCEQKPRRGSRVSVIGGSFAGLDGVFEREAGEERCIVLLSLLGRGTPVAVSSRLLAPAA
jgi:transcriptional antiterminator RfaH